MNACSSLTTGPVEPRWSTGRVTGFGFEVATCSVWGAGALTDGGVVRQQLVAVLQRPLVALLAVLEPVQPTVDRARGAHDVATIGVGVHVARLGPVPDRAPEPVLGGGELGWVPHEIVTGLGVALAACPL